MNRIFLFILSHIFFSLNLISQDSNGINIIKRPISYTKERIQLSIEYLKLRHNLTQSTPTITPKIIVLHYTAGGTLNSNFNYFNNTKIENARQFNKNQSLLNVSAHYLIDRDGQIYQLMDDTLFARHTIGLNYCAIGIENVGSKQEPLTELQISSNVKLVRHLTEKYSIEYLIGHSEYAKFRKSSLWKETNPGYFTAKEDPGELVMKQIRILIKDLKLKYQPK